MKRGQRPLGESATVACGALFRGGDVVVLQKLMAEGW